MLSPYDDWVFGSETAVFTVRDHFKVASLDGFGLKDRPAAIGAAGAVLHYLTHHLRRDAVSLTRISFYQRQDFLALDHTTLRHLEVLEPLHHDAPRNACLYGALNRTVTPMGARRLRDWLSQPLTSVAMIQQRQEATRAFIENSSGLDSFRKQLAQVRDMERTIGRLTAGTGNGRDWRPCAWHCSSCRPSRRFCAGLARSPPPPRRARSTTRFFMKTVPRTPNRSSLSRG